MEILYIWRFPKAGVPSNHPSHEWPWLSLEHIETHVDLGILYEPSSHCLIQTLYLEILWVLTHLQPFFPTKSSISITFFFIIPYPILNVFNMTQIPWYSKWRGSHITHHSETIPTTNITQKQWKKMEDLHISTMANVEDLHWFTDLWQRLAGADDGAKGDVVRLQGLRNWKKWHPWASGLLRGCYGVLWVNWILKDSIYRI